MSTTIKGTRRESDLSESEYRSLMSQEQQHQEALRKCLANTPDNLYPEVDLAVEADVEWDIYWVEHCHLKVQQERARLGLDWEMPETSERTIDGKPLVHGMRVWDYDLEKGTVDLSRADWSNAYGGRKSLWFDVRTDDGRKSLMNAERVRTTFKGESA